MSKNIKKGEKYIGLSGAGATSLGILILTEILFNKKSCCKLATIARY